MADNEPCLLRAAKIYGEHFTGKELTDLFNQAAEIKQKQIDMGFTDDIDARVADAIKKETQRTKQEAWSKKIRAQHSALTLADNVAEVRERVRGGLSVKDAVLSLFHGTIRAINNGRISIARQKLAYNSKLMGEVFGRIAEEKPHIFKLLHSEEFDAAVTRELQELGPGGKPGKTGNSDAQWTAELLNKQLKQSRIMLNKWGANLADNVGYVGPEAHNDAKINKHFKEWAADLMSGTLNLEASFPGLNPQNNMKEIEKTLEQAYHQIITGKNSAFGTTLGARTAEPPITSNFVFTNADKSIEYQKKWGYSSTIASALNMLASRANDAALMERFGANVDRGVTKLLAQLRTSIEESGGDRTELAGLTLESFRPVINIATGQVNHIQNHTIAKLASDLRATSMMALLGKALIASIPTDTMAIALAGMFRGNGFLRSLGGAIFKSLDGLSPEDRMMATYLYGEGFDGLLGHLHSASLAEDGRIGSISHHLTTYFYLNGLTPWTDSRRGFSARMIAAQLGRESDKNWGDLNWRLQNVLTQNGIGEKDWDNIRRLVQVGENGNKYIYPEGFEKLDHMTKYERDQLELNLRGYVSDEVNMGMLEGDAATQYYSLNRYGTRGTPLGELLRSMTQFTTFPVAFGQRILGRSFLGVPGATASERLMRATPHAGAMMAGMLAAYYMSWSMKELLKGNTPPVPTADNAKEFFPKLLIDSGVAGYYGSLVLDAMYNGRGVGSGGPVSDAIVKELNVIGKLTVLDYKKAGQIQYDNILTNTPYANLFYLRPVLDALFLNSIDEIVHPQRAETAARQRKKFGQQRLWGN